MRSKVPSMTVPGMSASMNVPQMAIAGMRATMHAEEPTDVEEQASAELGALQADIAAGSATDQQAAFVEATDSEFWFAVCFKTREQKEAFLKASRLLVAGDKYLDGEEVAEIMGVKLEAVTLRARSKRQPNAKLRALVKGR